MVNSTKNTSERVFHKDQGLLWQEWIGPIVVVSFVCSLLYVFSAPARYTNSKNHCASNLKKIGMAMRQYAHDYDETFPRSWFGRDEGPSDAKTNYKWMDAIYPYIKEAELFNCPADKDNPEYRFRSGTNFGCYVMNNAYYAPGDRYTPPAGAKFSDISSLTVLVTDGAGDFQFAWPDASAAPSITEGYPRRLGAISGRHKGNIKGPGYAIPLYADGHILGNSLEYISKPKQTGVYAGFTIEDD